MGFSVAGLMKAFVPSQVLAKHLGEPGLLATVKAALLGAPLPLCSCGVIPAALGLRRSGASKAATTSFFNIHTRNWRRLGYGVLCDDGALYGHN